MFNWISAHPTTDSIEYTLCKNFIALKNYFSMNISLYFKALTSTTQPPEPNDDNGDGEQDEGNHRETDKNGGKDLDEDGDDILDYENHYQNNEDQNDREDGLKR